MAPETEILLHETRAAYDAIMVGANTIKIDNSFLTVRLVPGKSPLRVIPNSMADISPDANVLKKDAPTVIAVARTAPRDRVEEYPGEGGGHHRRRGGAGGPPAPHGDPLPGLRREEAR